MVDEYYNQKAKEAVTEWNGESLKYIIRFRSVLLYDKEELLSFVRKPVKSNALREAYSW